MLSRDPQSTLRHYPTPMERYGKNPYQENLYRIVFAPSRLYIVHGTWPDGATCARWVPLYRALGDIWVMEKWRPAEEFAACSREQWDTTLGPYPERGEYQLCHVFEACGPDDANLEKLVKLIERRHRLYDIQQWHREDAEREQKQTRTTAEDMIRNKLMAFGTRPFSSALVSRGSKNPPILKSANELGLPTKPGLRTKPNKPPTEQVA